MNQEISPTNFLAYIHFKLHMHIFVFPYTVTQWNNPPESCIQAQTVDTFREQLTRDVLYSHLRHTTENVNSFNHLFHYCTNFINWL